MPRVLPGEQPEMGTVYSRGSFRIAWAVGVVLLIVGVVLLAAGKAIGVALVVLGGVATAAGLATEFSARRHPAKPANGAGPHDAGW